MGGWVEDEKKTLTKLYPDAQKAEVLAQLPERTVNFYQITYKIINFDVAVQCAQFLIGNGPSIGN